MAATSTTSVFDFACLRHTNIGLRYLVGDCHKIGKVYSANHDAFNVAVEV
jgi:hypothetical protein